MTRNKGLEFGINSLVIICLIFSLFTPSIAYASPSQIALPDSFLENTTDSEDPVSSSIETPTNNEIPLSSQSLNTAQSDLPPEPKIENIGFKVLPATNLITVNQPFIVYVEIQNNTQGNIGKIQFSDVISSGFEFVKSADDVVSYNIKKQEINYSVEKLTPDEIITFSYQLKLTSKLGGDILIHSASLTRSGVSKSIQATWTATTNTTAFNQGSKIAIAQTESGWYDLGTVSLFTNTGDISTNSILASTTITGKKDGPTKQYKFEVFQTQVVSRNSNGTPNNQKTVLSSKQNTSFKDEAFIKFKFDGVVNLSKIPAGFEPYVAVYDESAKIWVKVPIVDANYSENTVTVGAKHFSVWGIGLGTSLPQNGAGALLFDQPYTALFSGASHYEIPIWTPAGRNGLAPQISLSYSSKTADGILGDVQAPWVGMGWNIDDIEIVRKITTDANGYGYSNSFALTLNGKLYKLIRDTQNLSRYYVVEDGFMYIERHNFMLGNEQGVDNTTGEWWEVVTTDGTRYRLGWNSDSEQLALMYGYSCTVGGEDCITPNGAYASLGYAGLGTNLVAKRWRVDRITDSHGNYIDYEYEEFQPGTQTQIAAFDRESYLKSISYTGYQDPQGQTQNDLNPGYQIHFTLANRSSVGDLPSSYYVWDHFDNKYLDSIEVCLQACNSPYAEVLRTYDLQYSLTPAPNSSGTLLLRSIVITGGGFEENGISIPYVQEPKINFDYTNLANRAITTGMDAFSYPRLLSVSNGYGGKLTYTYETDGRGTDSWYNYRVKKAEVEDGIGMALVKGYSYLTPVYTGIGSNSLLGELVGYTKTTETSQNFNQNYAALINVAHQYGITGLDIGKELTTEWSNSANTVLQKKVYTYVTDNSEAPSTNWNYRYLSDEISYILEGSTLRQTTRNKYYRDPSTGNLLYQEEYLNSNLYRKTYFEYSSNTDKAVYILDRMTRKVTTDANNVTFQETRYRYDGNNYGQITPPTRGDLTLAQSLTGTGSQTVDKTFLYDVYGNVIESRQYKNFGTINQNPNGDYLDNQISYDSLFYAYAVETTNALGETTSTDILYTLGVPFEVTDANGWVSQSRYDGLGRILSSTPPGLNQPGVIYSYPIVNGNGLISSPYSVGMQILDMSHNVYRSIWGIYDGLGRMIQNQVFDSDTQQLLLSSTQFNESGSVKRSSLPYYVSAIGGAYQNPLWGSLSYTSYAYDPLGRVTNTTAPGGITTTTTYTGLATTTTDPNGHLTKNVFDELGRLRQVQEYSGSSIYATTLYSYDVGNHIVEVEDANTNTTSLQYNWLGQKVSMDDMDMGDWTYSYDAIGNLVSQTDARGQTLTLSYDELNRLLQKVDETTSTVLLTNVYGSEIGSIGKRISMTDMSGTTAWQYADFGRTVSETRDMSGSEKTFIYKSDWLGRVLEVTNPENEYITYTYDALGRESSLSTTQLPSTPFVELGYNALSQITSVDLANGITLTNTYNSSLRLANRQASDGINPDLIDFTYSYDNAGNITGITDDVLNESHSYAYDSLNRLTSAQITSGAEFIIDHNYEYDKTGNILNVYSGSQANLGSINNSVAQLETSPSGVSLVRYQKPLLMMQELETDTPTPTLTPTETETPTITSTPTLTEIPTPTSSPTLTATPVSTNTPIVTATPNPYSLHGLRGEYYNNLTFSGQPILRTDSVIDFAWPYITPMPGISSTTEYSIRWTGQITPAFTETFTFFSMTQGSIRLWVNGQKIIDNWTSHTYIENSGTISLVEGQNYTLTLEFKTGSGFGYCSLLWSSPSLAKEVVPSARLTSLFVPTFTPTSTQTTTPVPTAALTTGLMGYWTLDSIASNTVSDSSGRGHPGTVSAQVFLDPNGHTSNALRFDGVFGKITIADHVDFSPSGSLSISAWINPQEIAANRQTRIIDKNNAYSLVFTTNGQIQFRVEGLTPAFVTGPTLPLDQWSHVVGVYQQNNNQLRLYVNKNLVSSVSVTGTKTTNSSGLYFGSSLYTERYKGRLDEVRFYNRMLTDEEIGLLFGNDTITPTPTLTNSPTVASTPTDSNVALYKPVTGSVSLSNAEYINDGIKTGTPYTGVSTGLQYIQIDLGSTYYINQIKLWHYFTEGRKYRDVIVMLCPETTCTMKTIAFNNDTNNSAGFGTGSDAEYLETTAGKSIAVNSVPARYVRFYSNGSDINANNTYVEAEVWNAANPSVTSTPTATPTITPTPVLLGNYPWGTGLDGDLTINTGATYNISTQNNGSRSCADGGDGVSYSVITLTDTYADLSITPASGCLVQNDEIILYNARGSTTSTINVGNFEFVRIGRVEGSRVYFLTTKLLYYGESENLDNNIGTGSGQQRVVLQRVPNYDDVTINGTLTVANWNGNRNGLLLFKANGVFSGTGTISANSAGYLQGNSGMGGGGCQGDSYGGPGTCTNTTNYGGGSGGVYARGSGSGAGYLNAGTGGNSSQIYGDLKLSRLFMGSGGGGGAGEQYSSNPPAWHVGGSAGPGGGIIYVLGNQIAWNGTITANGGAGYSGDSGSWGGGGSGGTILIHANLMSGNGNMSVTGGGGSKPGSVGRTAIYFEESFTSSLVPNYLRDLDTQKEDAVFASDFETGNLDEWDYSTVDNGDLSTSANAAFSSEIGLQATVDDQVDIYVQDDSLENERQFRNRFYFNPEYMTMTEGDILDINRGISGSDLNFVLQLSKTDEEYFIRTGARTNTNSWEYSSWFEINNGWNGIETEYMSSGSYGRMNLWINGEITEALSLINNSGLILDSIQLGVMGIDVGTIGTLFFDNYESRRFSEIGVLPVVGIPNMDFRWGTGADGDITIPTGVTRNISTTNIASGRICPDGGDSISYTVTELTNIFAKVDRSVNANCLISGDEIFLFNARGSTLSTLNVGKYEFLRVESIDDNKIYFSNLKMNSYGESENMDNNIGIGTGQQRVILQRVPNYENATINGTLTVSSWNGNQNGIVLFRVSGQLSGNGTISANSAGYLQGNSGVGGGGCQGDSYGGPGTCTNTTNYGGGSGGTYARGSGSGAGYSTAGTSGNTTQVYGDLRLLKLYMGSGGGGGAGEQYSTNPPEWHYGGSAGSGGGIIFVLGNQITWNGLFSANGGIGYIGDSGSWGGGGSGGTILIHANTMTGNGNLSVAGGGGSKPGSIGRSAIYFDETYSSSIVPNFLRKTTLNLSDELFASTFDDATLKDWSSTQSDQGDLTVSAVGSYSGENGVTIQVNDNNDNYLKDESPYGETEYHARFYFNRGTLRMGVGDILDVFTGFDDSNSVFTVQVQKDLTNFQMRIGARNDLGTWTYNPTWTTISNDWNSIEVEYLRGTNSGEMRLWVNGVLAQTLTVLDTDTIAIDSVQLGVMGVDSGTRGTLYLDDFTSTRFSTIGMLPDPGVHENLPIVHTYTSQPDGTAGVDTFINSSGSTSNYGTIDYMWVGYSSDTNGKYRSLIKFNLASIPANATITSATLILRLNYQGGTTANTMSVYPLLKNWTETGVTWNRYDGTNNWQTAGAGGATDRDTTSMGSRSFVSSEPVGFKVIPLDVSTMQNYVNGTRANYGWLLKMDTESGFLYEFTTSDRYIAANRPQLVVEYTLPEEEPDWVNKAYTYEDADHIHAVTSLVVTDENDNQTTNTYRYDANGNMTCRIEGGETFLQVYNAENHMSGVLLVTGDCDTLGDTLKAWEFTYDGDGVKVKQEYTDTNGTLTTYYYAGGSYESQTDGSTETVRQYYAIAGVTAGMREGSTFYYFLTDHLGSIVGVTDTTGTLISETRYLPFGEIRTDVGTVSQTDYGYTFQRNVSDMGLMDYKARYYSNLLGRFVQPDSIIPGAGSPQAWNRFSYSNNNPINFNDPSGHYACKDFDENGKCVLDDDWVKISIYNSSNTKKITQILTNSFSLQAIKIIDSEESYSDFSGSGDPNTLIRPEWDNQKPKNSQNSPDAALSAIYDTTESGANASYVLFPNGNQVVTSYVQSFRSNRLAFVPSPKLIDVTITNNSQSLINYKLTINAENIALSSIVTASPGESVSFNIQPINIPINGLNISVSASSSCMSPCITRKDPILFRGWIQFFIP